MRISNAGLAGILLAAVAAGTASAQPYYPQYCPAYAFPYPFFAPYSAHAGPAVDGDTHY